MSLNHKTDPPIIILVFLFLIFSSANNSCLLFSFSSLLILYYRSTYSSNPFSSSLILYFIFLFCLFIYLLFVFGNLGQKLSNFFLILQLPNWNSCDLRNESELLTEMIENWLVHLSLFEYLPSLQNGVFG